MLKRLFTGVLIFYCGLCLSVAQTGYSLSVLKSTRDELVVLYRANPEMIETKDGDYPVKIPGSGTLAREGKPLLPAITFWLALPGKVTPAVQFEPKAYQSVTGVEPVTWEGAPGRSNETTVSSGSPFSFDITYPETQWKLKQPLSVLGSRAGAFTLFPVQTDPDNHGFRVLTEAIITIRYDRPLQPTATPSLPRGFFLNGSQFTPRRSSEPIPGPRMLVIAHDNFIPAIQPYVDWKNRQGIRTKLVATSEISPFPNAWQVYDYVRQAYLDTPSIDYLLLVGDFNWVPVFYGIGNSLNDHAYSVMDTLDYLPDITVGRFSVNTPEECRTYVDKVIAYERFPVLYSNNWYKKAMVIASNDGLDNQHGQQMRQFFLDHGFQPVDDYREITGTNTLPNVIGSLEEGRSWVFYIGHGYSTGWSNVHPGYTTTSIDLTDNIPFIPAIISIACANADLDMVGGDCFAEKWLKAGPQKGAVSILAATENCAFYWTDTLGKHAVFAYFNGMARDFGQAMDYGKLAMYTAFPQPDGGLTEETMQQFLILGDPTLQPFAQTPVLPGVNLPAQLAPGLQAVDVLVTVNQQAFPGALVCLYDSVLNVWASGYTDSAGIVPFSVNLPDTGWLHYTVTGPNLYPVEGVIRVGTPTGINPAPEQGIKLFPNPASGYVKLQLPEQGLSEIMLFDPAGRLIKTFFSEEPVMTIPLEGISPGLYRIRVETGKTVLENPLIILN